MYKRAAALIVRYIFNSGYGKKENQEIYEYSFECMVSLIANTVIVLMSAALAGKLLEAIVYMFFYISLRTCTGGAHQKTHFLCILTFILLAFASTMVISRLGQLSGGKMVLIFLLLISCVLVIFLAPVESLNKKINIKLKRKLAIKSRHVILFDLCFITLIMELNGINSIITSAVAGVFIQSFLLLPFFKDSVK